MRRWCPESVGTIETQRIITDEQMFERIVWGSHVIKGAEISRSVEDKAERNLEQSTDILSSSYLESSFCNGIIAYRYLTRQYLPQSILRSSLSQPHAAEVTDSWLDKLEPLHAGSPSFSPPPQAGAHCTNTCRILALDASSSIGRFAFVHGGASKETNACRSRCDRGRR